MNCPKCNGPTWDNRTSKRNPKQPDYKCKDKSCDGAIWLDSKKPPHPAASALGRGIQAGHQNGTGLDEIHRAIIRQHSQTAAIEVLKLKHLLGELTIADLAPAKLRALADYFDNDVIRPAPKPHRTMRIDEREDPLDEHPMNPANQEGY